MAQSLSLSSRVEVFPCPNCRQTINTSMHACSFCSVPIDHAAATASAEVFAEVNQACSDASYLKIMAGAAPAFLVARLLPIISLAGFCGFWFLLYATPVMTGRWFFKFGAISTDDPEFARARSTATDIGIGSAVILLLIAAGALRLLPFK